MNQQGLTDGRGLHRLDVTMTGSQAKIVWFAISWFYSEY